MTGGGIFDIINIEKVKSRGVKVEKERRIKTLSLVALIVAVLGLTVAFASLSQMLTINGTATVDAASWDVHFENLTGPDITGSASTSGTPSINDTTISGLNMSVTKPGDSVTYYFDIVNDGTIDAVLDTDLKSSLFYNGYMKCIGVTINDNPECVNKYDFNGDDSINTSDYSIIVGELDYAIYDTENNELLAKDDVIPKQTTKHYKLVLAIKSDSNYISSKNLSVEDNITLNFVQE